ncbi:MAG: PQQ-binding-like beta-propeller repeat protein [Oceanicaulis sp.]|nr:PQQ-binding-like beta-propeller repeat protein [Oceanicaulis sp.]
MQTGRMLWEVFFDNKENELARYPGITTTSHGFFLPGFGNWAFILTPLGERMRIDTDVFIYHSMVKDDILYAAHRYQGTGALSAYRLPDMELIWRYHPGDLAHLTGMQPLVENGRIYMATGALTPSQETVEAVFALDAATGQQLWRTNEVRSVDLADHCPDYLYLNHHAGLYKVRKSDGHLVYYKDFNAGTGSGPVAYLDGYAYVMTPGSMHIVRAEDGEIMARMSPPKGSFFWRVTAHDGRIFAQSSRHLYAFAPWGHTEPLSTSRRRWVDW